MRKASTRLPEQRLKRRPLLRTSSPLNINRELTLRLPQRTGAGLAVELGQYRFNNWDNLSAIQRSKLEGLQWTLLNYSSDFSSQAMTITLQDIDTTLQKIKDSTDEAQKAIDNIEIVDKIFRVAAAGVVLGAAIISGNPDGITSAMQGIYDAVSS